MSPSDKLGAWWPWSLLVDAPPLLAFFVLLFVSPLAIKFIIRPLWEGRIIPGRYEFMTFQMDVMFAPAVACGLKLVRALPDQVYLTPQHPLHWVFMAIGVGIGVQHFIQERKDYSWRKLTSFSKLYHELLFVFLGYLLSLLFVAGFCLAPWTYELVLARAVMVICLAAWALSWPLRDQKRRHQPLDEKGHTLYWYAHPERGHPWQHKYRELPMWWRRYRHCWRDFLSTIYRLVVR